MGKLFLSLTMLASALFGAQVSAQTVEAFLDRETAPAAGLTLEEYQATCAAVPRACTTSKENTKFSYWDSVKGGGWVIKGLSAKEWASACAAAAGKYPVCQIAVGRERDAFLKSKPGKICAQSLVWTPELCQKLADGKVEVGMTRRMVLASWGAPKTLYNSSDGREQWVYGGMGVYGGQMTYLFFEAGILKSHGASRSRE